MISFDKKKNDNLWLKKKKNDNLWLKKKKKKIIFDKKKLNFIITKRLFLRGKKENCYVHTKHW